MNTPFKTAETDENIGTARLVARARREIAAGTPLIPKRFVDRIIDGKNALRLLARFVRNARRIRNSTFE